MDSLRTRPMVTELLAPDFALMLDAKQTAEARDAMAELLDPELADLLSALTPGQRMIAFRLLSADRQARVFAHLSTEDQERLIQDLSSEQLAQLLDDMAPDDRATLLEEMPGEVTSRLLAAMNPLERRRTQFLLGYPPQSVGRIMTPDFLTVSPDWTIRQALEHFRQRGRDAETFSVVYVVDEKRRLLDDLRIRAFLLNDPERRIDSLMDGQFIALRATDDREEAVRMMDRYDAAVLPVVSNDGVMVGIVTFDDVADVARQEMTEDVQKLGGVEAIDVPYLNVGLLELTRKRGSWLSVLFIGEMLTASAMGHFEEEIQRASVLALFVPLIISSGGNSGSQASTLVVRALALGDVTIRQWLRVFRRELACGLLLGLTLAALGMLRIHLWQWLGWHDYTITHGQATANYHLVALTVALSLVGVVLWGSLIGGMLPLLLRSIKLDPATISAPFVATLVDVTGLIIYFTTALVILHNVLA